MVVILLQGSSMTHITNITTFQVLIALNMNALGFIWVSVLELGKGLKGFEQDRWA